MSKKRFAKKPEVIKKVEEAPVQDKPEAEPRTEKSKNPMADLYSNLPEPNMVEQTYFVSPYDSSSQTRPYNPDDLYQKFGSYTIYESMMKDDQVSICMKLKKDLILASGWDIVVEGDTPQDVEVKEYIEYCLREKTEGIFEDMLEEVLSAYEYGFSVTEKVFQKKEDGKLGLKYLRTRHPATWMLHTDEQGRISKYEQLVSKTNLELDPKILIHYVNQPKFQNPYGNSDLRAAYSAWFAKREVVKYFAMFLEKSAGPIPVARYNKNAPQSAVDAIHTAIKSFQAKTALTIPEDIKMEFLESKKEGQAYERAISLFNMFIGRSIFIPDLMGFQGGETAGGSYSLGEAQLNIFFKHIQRRRETLERIVNDHVIKPIVYFNYGEMEKFPKWKLRPVQDDNAEALAKLWIEAVKGKIYKPSEEEINHFRKLAKFPEGPVEFAEEPMMNPLDPNAPKMGPDGKPLPPEEVKEGEEDGNDPAKQGKKPVTATPFQKKEMAKLVHVGDYSKKVDFKAIETAMDRFKNRVLEQAGPVIKRIFKDLGDQISNKNIVASQKIEKSEGLKLKYLGELKKILKKNFKQAYEDAKNMGERELNKTTYARKPLPDDKFLEFIENETFQYVGDWEYNVLKKARIQINAAIRDGKPLSSVLDLLDEEGMLDSESSLERYARTKFTDVMNRGRLAYFNETDVVAAYQYSAILDDVTSGICEGLHGKIFKAGDEPIPPLHFNCRSLLVPITKYESFEVDKSANGQNIDRFIEENTGEGFSRFSMEDSHEKEPEIGDPGVDFSRELSDPTTHVYTYSKDGNPFKVITVKYSNEDLSDVISMITRRVKDAA